MAQWLPDEGVLDTWIRFPVSCIWINGCVVKVHGCLESLPSSLDLIPWLPGNGSWLPGFTFCCPRLGPMVVWGMFLIAW